MLKNWMNDPESEIILSFRSGGIKIYSLIALFQIIDKLELRESISEIWGSSMGSLIGYLYSIGLSYEQIEMIAFEHYRETYGQNLPARYPERIMKNLLFGGKERSEGLIELKEQIKFYIANAHYKADKNGHSKQIPSYALSTNLRTKEAYGLSLTEAVKPELKGFMRRAKPHEGVLASSAVPMLLAPVKIHSYDNHESDLWVDGYLSEDAPMLIPYQKWKVERKMGSSRKSKLKILAVTIDDNAKSNSLAEKLFEGFIDRAGITHNPFQIINTTFDIRANNIKRHLNKKEGVEVIDLKVPVPRGSLLDLKHIPDFVRAGRREILGSLKLFDEENKEKDNTKEAI